MSESDLSINVEQLKRTALVTVGGRIDSTNASQLDDTLKGLTVAGNYNIVMNLSGVDYMSSAGIRAVVSALRECKRHRGNVVVSEPSQRVVEVFDLAGLTGEPTPLFQFYENDAAAVGSF